MKITSTTKNILLLFTFLIFNIFNYNSIYAMETLEEYKKEQCLNQNKDVLDLKQTQDKEELKKNQVEDCMLPLASKDLNNEFINKIIKEIEEFSYTFMENSSDYIKLKKHQETTCNFFIL